MIENIMGTLKENDKTTKMSLSNRPAVKERKMIGKVPRVLSVAKSTSTGTTSSSQKKTVGGQTIGSSTDTDTLTPKERAIIEAAHARFISLPKDKKKGMSVKEMNAFFAFIESDQKDAIRS